MRSVVSLASVVRKVVVKHGSMGHVYDTADAGLNPEIWLLELAGGCGASIVGSGSLGSSSSVLAGLGAVCLEAGSSLS